MVRGDKRRRLHKAFLRYHDPDNWPMLRAALKRMGRADLIGNGKRHLVPAWQPAGTGGKPEKAQGGKEKSAKGRIKAKTGTAAKTRPAKSKTSGRHKKHSTAQRNSKRR